MSLQDILKKILDKAGLEISVIKSETEQQIIAIEKNGKDKVVTRNKEIDNNAEKVVKEIDRKTESMIRREISRNLANKKRSIIDQSLQLFSDYMDNLSSSDYQLVLEKLVGENTKYVEVLCSEKR